MQGNLIEFKTNLPTLTVLKISDTDMSKVHQALIEKSKAAPMMFAGLQVIVDLTPLTDRIDVAALKKTMLDNGINPVALMTDNQQIKQAALDHKLGWLPFIERSHTPRRNTKRARADNLVEENKQDRNNQSINPDLPTIEKAVEKSYEPKKTATENYEEETTIETALGNMLLRKQIRSGQRVYSQGDLTIIGSVSAGAEVIADGNIHIYGALRGRALAGAKGDENAKIFCQDMQAELISIAGQYTTHFTDIGNEHKNQPLQISLEDERIVFFPL